MTVSKSIPSDLLDSLLSDYQKPEDLLGENGLLKQLTKALVERKRSSRTPIQTGCAYVSW